MKKVKHGGVFTAIFSIISIGYIFPIMLVFINSFKKKAYISRKPFDIPNGKMYVGLENYVRGIKQANFFEGAKWSTVITVGSVFLIILCTSMCAWYIVRVKNALTKAKSCIGGGARFWLPPGPYIAFIWYVWIFTAMPGRSGCNIICLL